MGWHDQRSDDPRRPAPPRTEPAATAAVAVTAAGGLETRRGLLETLLGIQDLLADLAQRSDLTLLEDAQKVDVIAVLEHAKGTIAALQSRTEVALRDGQIHAQKEAGVPREKLGKGVADQIALARHITPKQASDQLALRRVLVETMPRTARLLARGEISEWGAHQVAQACLVLDDEDRDRVDAELEPVLPAMTATRAGGRARAIANSLDPEAAVRRTQKAITQRHVSLRPAPDSMCLLTALLPVQQGVACLAALRALAQTLRVGGEPRTPGQIMADTLVERVTGLQRADDVGIEVNLLMTDATLLGDGDDTAFIDGHAIPGRIARHLALGSSRPPSDTPNPTDTQEPTDSSNPADQPSPADRRFLRRLFTDPATGSLTGIDARRRAFTGTLRRFITARDQHCRTPWCDSPIRHIDHAHRYADGGSTDAANGIGHCERFNQVKEMPGWSSTIEASGASAEVTHPDRGAAPTGLLRITTPTGHEYTSAPPRLRQRLLTRLPDIPP